MQAPRFLFLLLAFCMFSTGASGLVNEYILATMTTYILGNSIEQFSIVIAAMMLMMGVSGVVQERMSDRGLVYKFMALEITMALVGGYAPLAIYAAYTSLNDHFFLVHYFFVLSVGFLIGFEIPVVMRIIDQYKVRLKLNLVLVYAMDYIGAFIGAIIWVKILLKLFPLSEISFIVAGANFLVALLTVVYFMWTGVIRARAIPITALALTTVALGYGYLNNRDFSNLMEQKFYDDPIVHRETTRYQHLVITENPKNQDLRLYINGNTQFSSLDEVRYHELLVHPLMSLPGERDNVLVLGGGDGLALRELLRYSDVERIALVDIDPAMIRLAASHPRLRELNGDAFADARVVVAENNALESLNVAGVYLETGVDDALGRPVTEHVASVDVYHIDADRFLGTVGDKKWDRVIIDLPDPASVELTKLYSRQFYRKLARHMEEDGMLVLQATSPYHAREAFLTIGNTLRAAGFKVLPYRQNVPSIGDWGFYLAWMGDTPADQVTATLRDLSDFAVETRFLTPELLAASMAFGKGELESERNCVNTIMFPCLLTQYTDYSWNLD